MLLWARQNKRLTLTLFSYRRYRIPGPGKVVACIVILQNFRTTRLSPFLTRGSQVLVCLHGTDWSSRHVA